MTFLYIEKVVNHWKNCPDCVALRTEKSANLFTVGWDTSQREIHFSSDQIETIEIEMTLWLSTQRQFGTIEPLLRVTHISPKIRALRAKKKSIEKAQQVVLNFGFLQITFTIFILHAFTLYCISLFTFISNYSRWCFLLKPLLFSLQRSHWQMHR